jgi:hypothetical protein
MKSHPQSAEEKGHPDSRPISVLGTIKSKFEQNPLEFAFFVTLSLLLLSFALLYSYPSILIGDGKSYWATLESLATQGNPSISEGLGWLAIESESGNFYGLHFFAYSLVSVPSYWILDILGLSTLKAFQLTNAALLSLGVFYTFFRSTIARLGKWIVVSGFLGSGLYYLGWSHPEIFSSTFLLIASLAFLDRRHALAALLSAVASLQNPSAIFFLVPIVLDLIVKSSGPRLPSWDWQRIYSDVSKVALASSPFAIPYLWSMLQFGVWNPIESRGFVDYRDITVDRLLSLVFDLNQGLIVGIPLLIFTVPFAVGVRLIHYLKNSRNLFARNDLLIIGFFLMALPVLTQQNWNAGHAVFIRYGVWLGTLLIVWVASELSMTRRAVWNEAIVVPAVFLQSLALVWAGGPFIEQHPNHVEFRPWVVALWHVAPSAYNPLPEIFIERLRVREGGAATPISFFNSMGEPTKTLTSSEDLDGALREICGAGSYEREPRIADPRELQFIQTEKGFGYVLGPVSCSGRVNTTMSGKWLHPNPVPVDSGWSQKEDWGTWSDGSEAIIRFSEDQWKGSSRLIISGKAFLTRNHISQTFEAEVNGVFAGSLRVTEANSEFAWLLDTPRGLVMSGEVVLKIRTPGAKSPFELGLSADTRELGIGLVTIELLQ